MRRHREAEAGESVPPTSSHASVSKRHDLLNCRVDSACSNTIRGLGPGEGADCCARERSDGRKRELEDSTSAVTVSAPWLGSIASAEGEVKEGVPLCEWDMRGEWVPGAVRG